MVDLNLRPMLCWITELFDNTCRAERSRVLAQRRVAMAKRRLFLVRVIHTLEESVFRDQITQALLNEGGEERLKEHKKNSAILWYAIDKIVESWNLYKPENASRLHVFADGWHNPATTIPPSEEDDGRLMRMLLERALKKGTPQSKIIEKMVAQGARLHSTEDFLWLMAHYHYLKDVDNKNPSIELEILLRQGRDRAIARRINEVVPEGEDGILFMGAAHGVHLMIKFLGFDQSIEVIDVLKPPEKNSW